MKPLLYLVTAAPGTDLAPYFEDQALFAARAGVPCLLLHYPDLPDRIGEWQEWGAVIHSGGKAGADFPYEPIFYQEAYRQLCALPLPQLFICRGFQLRSALGGAEVRPMPRRDGLTPRDGGWYEQGTSPVTLLREDPLFSGLPKEICVHQNHRNEVTAPPPGFEILAANAVCGLQAWRGPGPCHLGTQFHPERGNHPHGLRLLDNFFALSEI